MSVRVAVAVVSVGCMYVVHRTVMIATATAKHRKMKPPRGEARSLETEPNTYARPIGCTVTCTGLSNVGGLLSSGVIIPPSTQGGSTGYLSRVFCHQNPQAYDGNKESPKSCVRYASNTGQNVASG